MSKKISTGSSSRLLNNRRFDKLQVDRLQAEAILTNKTVHNSFVTYFGILDNGIQEPSDWIQSYFKIYNYLNITDTQNQITVQGVDSSGYMSSSLIFNNYLTTVSFAPEYSNGISFEYKLIHIEYINNKYELHYNSSGKILKIIMYSTGSASSSDLTLPGDIYALRVEVYN